jgi:transcription antitermination factor NusG
MRIGNDPAPVDDKMIEIIAARIDVTGFVRIGANLEPGAKVLVQAGPFKGPTRNFERKAGGADRIKILLDRISFQARVEVEKNHVKTLYKRHALVTDHEASGATTNHYERSGAGRRI